MGQQSKYAMNPAQQACPHDMVESVGRKLVCIGRVAHRADGDLWMEPGCGAVLEIAEWEDETDLDGRLTTGCDLKEERCRAD